MAQTFPSSTFIYAGDDNSNLTVSINIPATNTNDDLFFHLEGPNSGSWYGFGFGTEMAGSLLFVMYTSADGKNVTISPRLGTGHVMPLYTGNVGYSLLAGSGIINDTLGSNMVANVRCTNCRKWAGGSVDVTSKNQPMLYAVGGPDDVLMTNDYTATIHQHNGYGQFTLDMVAATGAGGIPSDTNVQTGVSHENDQGGHGPGSALHALFMCGTFIVLFPAGYLFLRIFERVWIHIALQSFGLFVTLLGAASGIALSIKNNIVSLSDSFMSQRAPLLTSPFSQHPHLNSPHQAIGLVVLLGVITQFTVGVIHHTLYKRRPNPTLFGKVHRFLGPAVIFIGLINGILGFNFTGNNRAIIGYIIIITLMVIFVSTCLYLKKRRRVRKEAFNSAAAQNFRQGTMEPQYAGVVGGDGSYYGAGGAGQDVPLQRVPLQREQSGHGQSQEEYYAPPGGPPPPPQYGSAPAYGNLPAHGSEARL